MRLSKRLQSVIEKAILESFGEVEIYLFGSRVDACKKGGDIDLALGVDLPKSEFRRKKSFFLASLLRMGFDLKIDLVQYTIKDRLLYDEITQNSVKF